MYGIGTFYEASVVALYGKVKEDSSIWLYYIVIFIIIIIEARHNFSIPPTVRDDVTRLVGHVMNSQRTGERPGESVRTVGHHGVPKMKRIPDKEFVFMKWFYFTIISTTTIGKSISNRIVA